jgi:hypothetical protein
MTESDWWGCLEPNRMLEFLAGSGKLSARKARLFGVAACSRVCRLVPEDRIAKEDRIALAMLVTEWFDEEKVLLAAERFADGTATQTELAAAAQAATSGRLLPRLGGRNLTAFNSIISALSLVTLPPDSLLTPETIQARLGGYHAATAAGYARGEIGHPAWGEGYMEETMAQCRLLRDLFFNPVRTLQTLSPDILTWQEGLVVRMAVTLCEERSLPGGELDAARLAVLGDALEDAGCTDAELLAHLRGPGPHVLGCWAVDLVTGKG